MTAPAMQSVLAVMAGTVERRDKIPASFQQPTGTAVRCINASMKAKERKIVDYGFGRFPVLFSSGDGNPLSFRFSWEWPSLC